MKTILFGLLASTLTHSLVSAVPVKDFDVRANGLVERIVDNKGKRDTISLPCDNTATSRGCWGDYSIDTNWYDVTPDTGDTVEYWLNVEEISLAPDGYSRKVLSFNGTVPGPTLEANWGDNLVIHVTNNLPSNGTAIHWHGIRQLGSLEYDGVPGVTQCPIPPGETLTYKFQATQYGSTWYHSHFTLQYGDGLLGPLIIHGPATAAYNVDVGVVMLTDWGHESVFQLWDTARAGAPPQLENGLIAGKNTFDCSGSTDPNCLGTGEKYELTVTEGQKYLIRLINTAVDGHFQFSIDGHEFQVIATDLVPIVPYTTDSLLVSIGQRYDIVVTANAAVGDYWIRAGWVTACSSNGNAADITGILRYDATSTANPTSTSNVTASTNCGDEPVESLVPYLALNVGAYNEVTPESLSFVVNNYFTWTINSSSLYLNWSNPTTLQIFNGDSPFPTPYNVVPVEKTTSGDEWAVYVIEDNSNFGLTHPIHLHGHDFWVLAQATGSFDINTAVLNLSNPPRRDVASLPGNGYLVLAFKIDNPGSWLMHCHIAWHASQGLAMQFVESQSQIAVGMSDTTIFDNMCKDWQAYYPTEPNPQDDSGI